MSSKSQKSVSGKKVISTGKIPAEGLLCNYGNYVCNGNRLEKYEYCERHILEEKTAPYKQCGYVYSNTGKRCRAAAYKKKEG